ncbi:MAG: hypothetical protein PWQ07_132 [Kosmotoga sp.]|nr:hypothetical protein [Kosmotoga sp.]
MIDNTSLLSRFSSGAKFMNRRFLTVTKILFSFGGFGRPFFTYVVEKELSTPSNDEDRVWRSFFVALKLEGERKYEEALAMINKALKKCLVPSLRYALLTRKLSLLLKSGRYKEGRPIYISLRKNLHKITPEIRYTLTINALLLYCSKVEGPYTSCLGKLKLNNMEENALSFTLLNVGRELVKKGKTREGIKKFIESFKMAEKSKHPAGMILALNAIAWYSREEHPVLGLKVAEKAAYLAGYFTDRPWNFYVLHTLFTLLSKTRKRCLVPLSRTIVGLITRLPEWEKERSKLVIEKARKIYSLFSSTGNSKYEVSHELREYLDKYIRNISKVSRLTGIDRKNISRIIHGKTRTIKGETLRKIIAGLNLHVDPMSAPGPIVSEWVKIRIDEQSRIYLSKLYNLNPLERKKEVFTAYSCFAGRRDLFRNLTRKGSIDRLFTLLDDPENLEKELDSKFIWSYFLYACNTLSDYEKARKALAMLFINHFPPKKTKKFLNSYFSTDETTRELVDEFIRNYIRYNRKWGIRLENQSYSELAKRLGLKAQSMVIAMYCFDKRSRRKVVENFLENLTTKIDT